MRACSPANSNMLRPPIFVGSAKTGTAVAKRRGSRNKNDAGIVQAKSTDLWSNSPAMAKFNCGILSALGTFLAVVASLLEWEGEDQTFLRGLLTGGQEGLFTGLLVVGHHL